MCPLGSTQDLHNNNPLLLDFWAPTPMHANQQNNSGHALSIDGFDPNLRTMNSSPLSAPSSHSIIPEGLMNRSISATPALSSTGRSSVFAQHSGRGSRMTTPSSSGPISQDDLHTQLRLLQHENQQLKEMNASLIGSNKTQKYMFDQLLHHVNSRRINTESTDVATTASAPAPVDPSPSTVTGKSEPLWITNGWLHSQEYLKSPQYIEDNYSGDHFFWRRHSFKKEKATPLAGDLANSKPGRSNIANGINSDNCYLIDFDGDVVNGHVVGTMGTSLEGMFNELVEYGFAKHQWSDLTHTICTAVCHHLAEQFPFLHLCDAQWKASLFASKRYHSFVDGQNKKRKRTDADKGASEGGKSSKKQKANSVVVSPSTNEQDVQLFNDADQNLRLVNDLQSVEPLEVRPVADNGDMQNENQAIIGASPSANNPTPFETSTFIPVHNTETCTEISAVAALSHDTETNTTHSAPSGTSSPALDTSLNETSLANMTIPNPLVIAGLIPAEPNPSQTGRSATPDPVTTVLAVITSKKSTGDPWKPSNRRNPKNLFGIVWLSELASAAPRSPKDLEASWKGLDPAKKKEYASLQAYMTDQGIKVTVDMKASDVLKYLEAALKGG